VRNFETAVDKFSKPQRGNFLQKAKTQSGLMNSNITIKQLQRDLKDEEQGGEVLFTSTVCLMFSNGLTF